MKHVNETELIQKITDLAPVLITVYNIKTGIYIFVNDAIEKLLGYKKEAFLEKGIVFATSIVHPDDIVNITKQNEEAVKKGNSKKYRAQLNKSIVTSEYRMKHKNGTWRWLQTNGALFSRDKKGDIECVINASIDITDQKEREMREITQKDLAEKEKNTFYQYQIRSYILRSHVIDILRKEEPLHVILKQSLEIIVKDFPAVFGRIWLADSEEELLNLAISAGDYPPEKSIKNQLKFGEYAVGMVAKRNEPYITNNIYETPQLRIQNLSWVKKKNIRSFAGYPLSFKNKIIGVFSLFTQDEIPQHILNTLASIVDMLAQEIVRRRIEHQLSESQERYNAFIQQSTEGIWRFETEVPIPISLSVEKQIDYFYKYTYLAECNDALARMYGFKRSEEVQGARLGDMFIRDDPRNIEYLTHFITSGYHLSDSESVEVDRFGNKKFFQNNLVGIIKNNYLIRAWGIQQDITQRKKAQLELLKLSKQKDEFIAIASHELKTPVTSLKAYTQVLENRFKKEGDKNAALLLHKMDSQLDKLTTLISDLLDVSKVKAGRLQFHISSFQLNRLIKDTVEEMQRTTDRHVLQLQLDRDTKIAADMDRVGQVLINFISNAIKYSPHSEKIIIKSKRESTTVKVMVQDFGVGISKKDQAHVFDRFFRGNNPKQESYPGLGLGLYISYEIIKRHGGTIGVMSTKGKGSTFYFTLPLK